MSGIQTFQKINLQIIKAYKFQRYPIVSVCLDHQEGNERLYFGTCEEPSNRLAAFHDLSLFVNSAYYYVHRNTQETYQGLIPIMYNSFYRNQFTNMVFLGPPGISEFLIFSRFLLGIRNIAFGALDIHKDIKNSTQKLGLGNQAQFIELAKNIKHPDFYGALTNINGFIRESVKQFVQPRKLINRNLQLESKYYRVVPLFGDNPNLAQYLVLFNVEQQIDYNICHKLGIPLSRIPEIKEGKYKLDGKPFTFDNLKKQNAQLLQQALLTLDFQNTSEINDFMENAFTKLRNQLQQYSDEFYNFKEYKDLKQSLVIVHYAEKSLLETVEYQNLIKQLKSIDYKIFHVIVTQEFYHILDKLSYQGLGREQFSYYYLDYIKQMKTLLPGIIKGREPVSQFQKSSELSDIKQLWPEENKYLPMRMKTIQIAKGNLFYENLEVKRLIQFSIKKDDARLLKQLHNKMKSTIDNQNFKICMLGTSSSVETQSRNASSIHIQLPTVDILLDCGQNTINQMYSCSVDDQDFINKLKRINIVYISHFHNDHHQGLFEFIKHKCKYSTEPCYILIPAPLFTWYNQCLTNLFVQEFGTPNYQDKVKLLITQVLATDHQPMLQFTQNFDQLESEAMQFPNFDESLNFDALKAEFLEFLQQKNLQLSIVYTIHCQQSTSIKLIYEGKSLVYSGDRLGKLQKFGNKFSAFAANCDILIHECTYPEELKDKANKVRHSTIMQAFFTAFHANAKYLVLTHFTERSLFSLKTLFNSDGNLIEPALKRWLQQTDASNQPYNIDDACKYFQNNVVMANDFMTFGEKSVEHLSQISRIIAKTIIP